ncbi:UNVERIFIED_CONTAM: hypothetical protein FKN15_006319 [Acipenser sinensis]
MAICQEPVLISPDFKKPFILQTDASAVGLGAVLSQEKNGEEHPVLFLSRKLLPREIKYAIVEKECMAIKWAVEALRYYLWGRKFTLVTDHAPLKWLYRNKDGNARVTRWFLSLQPYCFELKYRKGKEHINADFFSRYPQTEISLFAQQGEVELRGWVQDGIYVSKQHLRGLGHWVENGTG